MSRDAEKADALVAPDAKDDDFGPLSKFLLRVANVDRRDVISHSDRVVYRGIGFFVLLFGLYAFIGWMVFLSTVGVNDLGEGIGIIVQIVGSLVAAVAVATFDRSLVGKTNTNLDFSPSPRKRPTVMKGASDDGVDFDGSKLVTGRPLKQAFLRVTVAIIIAYFVTQAIDLMLFGSEITEQRAEDRIAALTDQRNKLVTDRADIVATHNTRVAEQKEIAQDAKEDAADARKGSHGVCRTYLENSTTQPSQCRRRRRVEINAQKTLTDLTGENPRNPISIVRTDAFERNRDGLQSRIDALKRDPELANDRSAGPLSATQDLYDYLREHDEALIIYLSVFFILLLLDLAAILLKLTNYDSAYERRQALRSWRAWNEVIRGEARAYERQLRRERDAQRAEIVDEAERRELAQTAIVRTAAAERALRSEIEADPDVRAEAREAAAAQVADELRKKTPPRQPPNPWPDEEDVDDDRFVDDEPGFGQTDFGNGSFDGDRRRDDPGTPFEPERKSHHGRVSRHMPGSVLLGESDSWVLDSPIAQQGAHSTVWKGHHRLTPDTPVAIKIMRVPKGDVPYDERGELRRVLRERDFLESQGGDPVDHIVPVLDFGQDPECAWYVMQWAENGTLQSYYDGQPIRPLKEVLVLAWQVAEGLHSLRGNLSSAVHRDIKPENLLLHREARGLDNLPELWIADWGIWVDHGETDLGQIPPGTIAFAAPQSLLGSERVHIADDLYSIGAVMWWCITGEPPGIEQVGELLSNGIDDRTRYIEQLVLARRSLPSLHDIQPTVPQEVAAFVANLLGEHRDDRTKAAVGRGDRRQFLMRAKEELDELIEIVVQQEELTGQIFVGPGMGQVGGARGFDTPLPSRARFATVDTVSSPYPTGPNTTPPSEQRDWFHEPGETDPVSPFDGPVGWDELTLTDRPPQQRRRRTEAPPPQNGPVDRAWIRLVPRFLRRG